MSKASTQPASSGIEQEQIEVGSFFLETLTTGMYEDPFHCIREYIQNSFDAIQDAVRAGVSKQGDGRISISLGGTTSRPSLSVLDDGIGIPARRAVSTLVSLGASRKTPEKHAGFRGIGRLAGIAYCSVLRFTTKAAGDKVATVVEFDCGRLRGYMKPGADPQDVRHVVRASVTTSTIERQEDEHFTEVEMIGLTNVGLEFVQMEKLLPYLRQVAPVDYSDRFQFSARIHSLAESYGERIPIICLETRHKRERTQILKAYQNSSPIGGIKKNVTSDLVDIETVVSKEHGWYGWIGLSTFMGEITDDTVAGIRFRIKNIQVGDSRIIEDITEEIAPTERRLQRYAVGEIFISNTQVVPNARRDGFEDNAAWRSIKNDIKTRIAKRVIALVRAASESRSLIKKIRTRADEIELSLKSVKLTSAAKSKIAGDLKKQLTLLESDRLTGADPNEVSALVSRMKGLSERLAVMQVEDEPTTTTSRTTSSSQGSQAQQPPPRPPKTKSIFDIVREVLSEELGENEAERLTALIAEKAKQELE